VKNKGKGEKRENGGPTSYKPAQGETVQCRRAACRGQGKEELPVLNFWLSENCQKIFFLSENFRSKMLNSQLKTPMPEKFSGKLKFYAPTHNLLRPKI